jgi:hypothetical protein
MHSKGISLLGALCAASVLLVGCSGAGQAPLGDGGNTGSACTPARQQGKPVTMGLFDLANHGTAPVTVRSVSLPGAHGMAMTTAFLVPMNNNGPQLGFGFAYPPVTYPFWADRVPASGATIQPGQDLTLVFGVTRTTDANGHSNGPMIVYTSGRSSYTLREKISLGLSRTACF